MSEFTFKVNLVAVVRVRAADESVARQVVSTILGAPGTVEIGLANENNAAVGNHATITDVDSLSLLGRSSALGARLKIRQHYSSPLALGGNNSSSLGARLFRFTALGDSFTTSGVGISSRQTNKRGSIRPEIVSTSGAVLWKAQSLWHRR